MSIENCHKDAVAAVAAVTGISPEEITGKCKARHLVDARWMVAMLMWNEGYYPRQIAGQMGVSVRWIQKIVECFQNHPTTGGPFRGWITVRLAQAVPAGTATTAEVVFTTEGGNATPVYGYDGAPATVENLRGTGVYLFWYEGSSRYLQLVTGNFI